MHAISAAAREAATTVQNKLPGRSVITTLANGVLAHYGKTLVLLLGVGSLAVYYVIYIRKTGLQKLEPSSSLARRVNADALAEVKKIFEVVPRHQAQFVELEKTIPKLIAHIQKNLISKDIDDIRGCRALLADPGDNPPTIAAIKLGLNRDWILPKGSRQTARISVGDTGYLASNKAVCKTILNQLGVKETDSLSFDLVHSMNLKVENSQVTEIECLNKAGTIIGTPIKLPIPFAIDFILAPKIAP
jgi:hypothetical protein